MEADKADITEPWDMNNKDLGYKLLDPLIVQ